MYNGILFSHKKGRNLPICDTIDGPWAHYAKWDKSDTSTVYHLFVESNKIKYVKNRE